MEWYIWQSLHISFLENLRIIRILSFGRESDLYVFLTYSDIDISSITVALGWSYLILSIGFLYVKRKISIKLLNLFLKSLFQKNKHDICQKTCLQYQLQTGYYDTVQYNTIKWSNLKYWSAQLYIYTYLLMP